MTGAVVPLDEGRVTSALVRSKNSAIARIDPAGPVAHTPSTLTPGSAGGTSQKEKRDAWIRKRSRNGGHVVAAGVERIRTRHSDWNGSRCLRRRAARCHGRSLEPGAH